MEHDDTPWAVEAIEPIVIKLRPTLTRLDREAGGEVVRALRDALLAGYRAGAAGASFMAETIAREQGFDLQIPPLEERRGGGHADAEAA